MMRRITIALVLAAAAAAPDPAEAGGLIQVLPELGPVKQVASGLYEVQMRSGPPLYTHGVDGPEVSAPLAASGARPPVCAASHHQHILYGRPATAPDRLPEVRGIVSTAISTMNATLDAAALASGGRHADYRVRCDSAGEIAIGIFVNHRTASFADVVDAAREAGATDADADYTIFYDDPSPKHCGTATLHDDDRLSADNRNNAGGGYAVAYSGCWDAATLMHENAHNQGAVQPHAPHSTGSGGHCRDEEDVMCYADGGEGPAGMLARCSGRDRFDCGDDDYFDVAPEPGEWLATHWNLGSPLNRFIQLTDVVPGELMPEEDLSGGGSCGDLPAEDPYAETGCEDDGGEDPYEVRGVHIGRGRLRLRGRAVALRVRCPLSRDADCRGRLRVRAASRALGRRAFAIAVGETASVRLAIPAPVRRSWGRRRRAARLRVSAYERRSESTTSRTLRVVR